jgi:hypothetical protein
MKFEIVEQPGEEPRPDDHVDEITAVDPGDPLQALKAGTSRLSSGVRAEALQISACVAEAAELAARDAATRLRRHDRVAARPPAGFRPARFGASRGPSGVERDGE